MSMSASRSSIVRRSRRRSGSSSTMSTRTGSPEGLATRTGLGRSQLADEPWEHLEVVLGHAASDPDLSGRSADVVVEERAVEDADLARPLSVESPGHGRQAERRAGDECGRSGRNGWELYHQKKMII